MKALILDFMGIIADPDYVKYVWDLPLTQKFSALRIFLSLKKYPIIRSSFNDYQMGLIDSIQLEESVAKVLPNSSYVVPSLLERLPNYINVNEDVIALAYKLRRFGVRTFVMSNAIPETEIVMQKYDFSTAFEDVMLSTDLGLKKPDPSIFQHALNTYGLDPKHTIMIDDSKKNLTAANSLGIKTICCKNSKEVCDILKSFLHFTSSNHELN